MLQKLYKCTHFESLNKNTKGPKTRILFLSFFPFSLSTSSLLSLSLFLSLPLLSFLSLQFPGGTALILSSTFSIRYLLLLLISHLFSSLIFALYSLIFEYPVIPSYSLSHTGERKKKERKKYTYSCDLVCGQPSHIQPLYYIGSHSFPLLHDIVHRVDAFPLVICMIGSLVSNPCISAALDSKLTPFPVETPFAQVASVFSIPNAILALY